METTDASKEWGWYYSLISDLYDLINTKSCKILYQHNKSPFTWQGMIDPNYRAILQLPRSANINILAAKIDDINETYFLLKDSNKRLPQYIPKLLTNANVSKIQIHENIAHSSKNYPKDTEVPIAWWPNNAPKDDTENDAKRRDIYKMIQELKTNGYNPIIKNKILYSELLIKTNSLIEKFDCNSVQHRRRTGLQIRANYFTTKDGYLEKSKLSSIGVLLIPYDIEINVFKSAKRKIRSDAIYHKKQSDEIIFEEVPLSLKHGKHYTR